jgi:hypothetical protein
MGQKDLYYVGFVKKVHALNMCIMKLCFFCVSDYTNELWNPRILCSWHTNGYTNIVHIHFDRWKCIL